MYNQNYIIKNVGYFKNYIYKYKDYVLNQNILEPFLLKDKYFIIYISYKNNIEENVSGICFFSEYSDFIKLVNESLSNKFNNLNIKELNNIIIKVWMYKEITAFRKAEIEKKEFEKKLLKFQKVIEQLITYKVNVGLGKQEYSRFLIDKILTKELKPVLHIKVMDEEMQAECLKHLLNLMSKKWVGVKFDVFKLWVYKTIQLYQDNYEQNDLWEIKVNNKE